MEKTCTSLDEYMGGNSLATFVESVYGGRLGSRCGNACGEKLISGGLQ